MAQLPSRRQSTGGADIYDSIVASIEKRLFVARVPSGARDDELREVFEPFGVLTECRTLPGKSVAFVGFETWAAAQRALIDVDDAKHLPNHRTSPTLSVCFAERSKKSIGKSAGPGHGKQYAKGSDNSRIFVGSLPESFSDEDLKKVFQSFGEITGANLLPVKGARRCGFVNFSLWGEAMDAVEAMNGKPLPSGSDDIVVKIADPAKDGSTGSKGSGKAWSLNGYGARALSIAGVGGGETQAVAVRRRPEAAGATPFNVGARKAEFDSLFVQYRVAVASASSSNETCERLHRALMDLRAESMRERDEWQEGGPSWPARSRSRSRTRISLRQAHDVKQEREGAAPDDDEDSNRLFIRGLPEECQDEELRALVKQLKFRCHARDAELLECRMLDRGGCGFLTFRTREAAEEALEQLDDRLVSGWPDALRARWAPRRRSGSAPCNNSRRDDSREDYGRRGAVRPRHRSYSRDRSPPPRGRGCSPTPPRRRYAGGSGNGNDDDDELDRNRLFVGQISNGISEDKIVEVFRAFGRVEDCRLLHDKGIAYVTFVDADDAFAARRGLNGAIITGISRNDGLNVQHARRRR